MKSIVGAVLICLLLLARGATAATLAVGSGPHASAIGPDGRVWLWGVGWGNSSFADPTLGTTAQSVTATLHHQNCALRQDGTVWCEGDQSGIAGTPDVGPTFQQVLNINDPISQISTGRDTSCAVTTRGAVWCWGGNAFSSGGLDVPPSQTPWGAWKLAIQNVSRVVAGSWSTCAVKTDGTLWCWGRNDYGQLGDGTTTDSSTPLQLAATGSDVTSVAVGDGFMCVLKSAGTVWCWGRNDNGQLGVGNTIPSVSPQQVVALGTGVVQLVSGTFHTCAIAGDRTVWCWGGQPSVGRLGNGSTGSSATPVRVTGLQQVAEIALGPDDSCARTTASAIWCWGDPGQMFVLGTLQSDGTTSSSPTGLLPVLVPVFPAASASVPAGNPGFQALLALALIAVAAGSLTSWRSASRRPTMSAPHVEAPAVVERVVERPKFDQT